MGTRGGISIKSKAILLSYKYGSDDGTDSNFKEPKKEDEEFVGTEVRVTLLYQKFMKMKCLYCLSETLTYF